MNITNILQAVAVIIAFAIIACLVYQQIKHYEELQEELKNCKANCKPFFN